MSAILLKYVVSRRISICTLKRIILLILITGCSDSNASSKVVYGTNESFSMASVNPERPKDVLEKVSLFIGGGGGSNCDPYNARLNIPDHTPRRIELKPFSLESTGQYIQIESCGWSTEGVVYISLELPNGDVYYDEGQLDFEGESYVYKGDTFTALYSAFIIENSPPLGDYKITFKGPDGSISYKFEVVFPKDPKLYRIGLTSDYKNTSNPIKSGDLVLWNFAPYETISLYAYARNPSSFGIDFYYVGYKEYVTDENGNLYITTGDIEGEYSFIVKGQKSGQFTDRILEDE